MKKNWVRIGVILLLTIIFLFFFFKSVDWKEVSRYLGNVNPGLFVLSILLVPLHLVTRSLRWRCLLVNEKKDAKFSNMFSANALGFGVSVIFPGRIGEVVRPLFLAKKENIRAGFSVGTIVVERTFDLFANCVLIGIFFLARPLFSSKLRATTEAYSKLYLWGIIGAVLAVLLLLVCLSLYFFRARTLSGISFLLRPFSQRFTQRALAGFESFFEGLKFFQSMKTLLLYAAFSFAVWLGIVFFYWIFFLAFKIDIPFYLLYPYVFFTGIGASIPTPGMVGGFHYFSKLGLTTFYGVDMNLAVGATIVVHAIQIVVTALLGYVILWKEGMTLFQLKKMREVETR